MNNFQFKSALASGTIERKDGTLVKSFSFHADEMIGWEIELAALDKKGNLNIMIVKRKDK